MSDIRPTGNGSAVCPLCGRRGRSIFVLAHTVVWQCKATDCGLQFADPQPSDQELERAYRDFYYPQGERPTIRFENTPESTLRQALRVLRERFGSLSGLRLLDYGCGRGALLRVSREFGLQPSGIESDPLARAEAVKIPGADIHSTLDELLAAAPDPYFDLITLWTVVEHLRTPWAELARLRTLLRPGGKLLLSTMNIRCLRARLERHRWENYENPTHLYYFDGKSLTRAIRAAGFEECEPWRLKIRHQHHGVLRHLLYGISFYLRLADGLYFLCGNGDQRGSGNAVAPEASAKAQSFERYRKGTGKQIDQAHSRVESNL
jgi:2-polyprenyl-3-methyl-5-hydroxy-6-metoxy-1,4-benzoquinol methylase